MNNIDNTGLEDRLARALYARAEDVAPSVPAGFSWQGNRLPDRAPRRRRRTLVVATPLALTAAVVGAVLVAGGGGSSTPPTVQAGGGAPTVQTVAFLRPGGMTHMSAGEFFYRKEVRTMPAPNADREVVELWQPQAIGDVWTVKSYQETAAGAVVGAVNTQTGTCGQFLKSTTPIQCDVNGSWAQPTPAFLTSLPTDPAQLYKQMYAYVLADYKKSASERKLDFSTPNLSFLTINYIRAIASSAGGMSEPFSKALEGATALVPGVIVKHGVKNLAGATGTSYEIDASPTNIAGPLIFDAAGNYIGDPASVVSLGTAPSAGATPTLSQ